jgi:hypothetical protein
MPGTGSAHNRLAHRERGQRLSGFCQFTVFDGPDGKYPQPSSRDTSIEVIAHGSRSHGLDDVTISEYRSGDRMTSPSLAYQ